MLFNSYIFLFAFLPVALLGFELASRRGRTAVIGWLAFASLAFYAYWYPPFLILLVASILFNYLASGWIAREKATAPEGSRRPLLALWTAIAVNLLTLGYFKYFFALLGFVLHLAGSTGHLTGVALPLGISFFTFTQIAFLVDLEQGIARRGSLLAYTLFVTFFPHLIAGPILHHREMMPQFLGSQPVGPQAETRRGLRLDDVTVGFTWFLLGLGKKAVLADNFAPTADALYALHGPLHTALAWRGVLSYALQLYFDFSGYSDMALGLARMFSIGFPLNFNSPYKAVNIVEFWQRFHMTLTRYITEYVYNPLQKQISSFRLDRGLKVSRRAQETPEGFASMIALPTIFTLFVAGVWHGAGLQFMIYGLLHGAYITLYHAWRLVRHARESRGQPVALTLVPQPIRDAACVLLTFLVVVVSQVFFRASSTHHALTVLASMIGAHGLHGGFALPGETHTLAALDLLWIALGLVIVWTLPNTQQILTRWHPSLNRDAWNTSVAPGALRWMPRAGWAVALGCLLLLSLVSIEHPSSFLYFQF